MKNNYFRKIRSVAAIIIFALLGKRLGAQVTVNATGGTLTQTYTTVGAAFTAINAGTHTGAISIEISVNTTETGPCVLNSSGAGTANYTAINLYPTTDGVSISGATVSGRGLIELNGADNVTIDGDNPNTAGTNRNLTIQNTAANTVGYSSVIRIALSTLITSADNNIFRNLIISGNATGLNTASATSTSGPQHTTFGIVAAANASTTTTSTAPSAITSVSTTIGSSGTLSNLLIENNEIDACGRGIAINASATTVATNLMIANNIIGNATPGNPTTVYSRAITIQGYSNAVISGNTSQNIESFISSATYGIIVGDASTSGQNATIENNRVTRVYNKSTTTLGAVGISLSGGNGHTVRNNFISDINHDMSGGGGFSTTFAVSGIRVNSGSGHKILYNSVNLFGSFLGTAASSLSSAALYINSTSQSGMDVRNNIFANTMTGGTTSIAHVCIILPSSATSSMNLTLNNNAYYSGSGPEQGIAHVGTSFNAANLFTAANFNPSTTSPATNLRSYTSGLLSAGTNDNASYASTNAAPFTSQTDLHLNISSPEIINVEQKGDAGISITTDIDGDSRPSAGTTNPDMGADEASLPSCSVVSGGTASVVSTIHCDNSSATLTASGATTGFNGLTYQWKVSLSAGGPYTNVSGGNGANNLTYTTGPLTAGTYYYVLEVTCSNGGATALSTEASVTVNPLPTVAVTPNAVSLCYPGSSTPLVASGADTYTWSPATGLSAVTGANVTANPTVTTTYIVTGTDVNGCINSTTASITINQIPVLAAVTATPSEVCIGGNSQLQATAANTAGLVNSYLFAASTGATLNAMTGATTVISTGVDDTPTATPQPIGFPFLYNGAYYTDFSVSPDGWILLGGATASSQFTNNTTSTTNIPKIYPYWDDIATGTTGSVSTLVTGTAPNRIFIVQWNVTVPRNTTGAANSTFQAWLYELDGKIEFRYGVMGPQTGGSASGGLTAGATNFQSITFSNNTASSLTADDSNTGVPTAGTMYTFSLPTTGSGAFSWSPATFLNNTAIANPTASGITSTTTYTVTLTINGCSTTGTVTINAGTALTSTASITPAATVCEGVNVTLNATAAGGGAPYTYAWSGPNGFSSASQNPNFPATLSADGTYSVVVTDDCGTTSTSTTTLTVNATPIVSVTPNTTSVCMPGAANVTLTASGATTYSWGPATGLSATTGNVVDATPSSSITYTVTGTASNGCTDTATAVLNVTQYPVAGSVTASPSAVCSGGSTQLQANFYNPIQAKAYQFSASTGATLDPMTGATTVITSGVDDTPTASPQAIGFPFIFNGTLYSQYSVSPDGWILLGGATATSQFSNSVISTTNTPKIYPYWDDMATGSTGDVKTLLTGTAPNRIFIVQWFVTIPWSTTGAANSTFQAWLYEADGKIEFRYGAMGPQTSGDASGGLTASATNFQSITFSGNTVSTSTANNLNPGVPASGTMYTFSIPTSSPTYAWSPSTFLNNTTVSNPMATGVTTGTTYTVTYTDNGCATTGTVSITVNPNPTVNLGTDITQCASAGNITLDAGNVGSTYAWSTTATTQTISVNTSGTYIVTVTDANTCTDADTINVTVNANPVVNLGTDIAQCTNDGNVTLDAGNAGSTYVWSTTETTQTITVATSGTYTVLVTNANSCTDADTINVTVNPNPSVNLGTDITQCASGGNITLDAGNVGLTYAWSTTETTQTISVNTSGTYIVTVTDVNTCTDSDTIDVTINANPVVNLGTDIAQCTNDGNVTLDAGNAGSTYVWNTTETTQTISVATSGTYTVLVTDANSCTDSDTIDVTINTSPVVSLGSDISQCASSGSVTLDAGNAGATYLWNTTETTQTVTVATSGTYTVLVTDANSCTDSDTIDVTISPVVTVDLGADVEQCASAGPVVLDAGNAGATYSWSTTETTQTISVSTSGTYIVNAVNGLCQDADTIDVVINANPVVTLTLTTDSMCIDDAALDLSSGASPAGGIFSGTGVSGTNFDAAVAGSGTFNVVYAYTDTNGCVGTDTSSIYVDLCTGLDNAVSSISIQAYPNPNKGNFVLQIANAEGAINATIISAQGKLVLAEQLNVNATHVFTKHFNLDQLANGIYYLQLRGQNVNQNIKINVQK